MKNMIARYSPLAAFLVLVVLAAGVAGSFEAGEWYYKLYKPFWTPPAWLYALVWPALYLMMAVAAWKVWLSGHPARYGALTWWVIQLLMNSAWSWLFFSMERPGWAWLEMSLLIAVTLFCIKAFHQVARDAVVWMLPYLGWLFFAWLLNFALWNMNGGPLARIF
jgi:tryptophan-rich sensory protein